MKKRLIKTTALLCMATMLVPAAACGKKKEETITYETQNHGVDLNSVKPIEAAYQYYNLYLSMLKDGVTSGWTAVYPSDLNLGESVKAEGTELGYLITDMDRDGMDELVIAKKSDDEFGYHVILIYSMNEDGSIRIVYTGYDDSEMLLLKKQICVVVANEAATAETVAETAVPTIAALEQAAVPETEAVSDMPEVVETESMDFIDVYNDENNNEEEPIPQPKDDAVYETSEETSMAAEDVIGVNETEPAEYTGETGELAPGAYHFAKGAMESVEVPDPMNADVYQFTEIAAFEE